MRTDSAHVLRHAATSREAVSSTGATAGLPDADGFVPRLPMDVLPSWSRPTGAGWRSRWPRMRSLHRERPER